MNKPAFEIGQTWKCPYHRRYKIVGVNNDCWVLLDMDSKLKNFTFMINQETGNMVSYCDTLVGVSE